MSRPVSRSWHKGTLNLIASHTISALFLWSFVSPLLIARNPQGLLSPQQILFPLLCSLVVQFTRCVPRDDVHPEIFNEAASWIVVDLHESNLTERLVERLARHLVELRPRGFFPSELIVDDSSIVYGLTSARLRQSSSWAGVFSMQMARMKDVRQNDTERHRKMSSLQQLKFRFRQCCAVHMHILSIKPLSRQHQLMPETQSSWTRRGCSIAAS